MQHYGHVCDDGGVGFLHGTYAWGSFLPVVWGRGVGDSAKVMLKLVHEPSGAGEVILGANLPDDGSETWPAYATDAPASDYALKLVRTAGVWDGSNAYSSPRYNDTFGIDAAMGGGCPLVSTRTPLGWIGENTILGRSLTSTEVLDDYRLKSAPDTSGGRVDLRILEAEQEYTTLDQVRLIAVDHSPSTRAYAAGERVLLGTAIAATRVTKSNGEDVTTLLSGSAGSYTGQPGDTLLVEMGIVGAAGLASGHVGGLSNSTLTGGGGGDIIDDGGGKGPQPGTSQQRAPTPEGIVTTDATVLGTSGIFVQAPDGLGDWQTITHYYPRERPDGAVLDTVGYDRLRLVFVGQHSVRFIGRLVPSAELIVATKLPMLAAQHSRHGDVSQAVSALGNLTTDLAPGDTVSISFQNVPLSSGLVRELFLFTNGVYTSNLPAGAPPAPPVAPPDRFALRQNQPNPFSATTTIRFDLPVASLVRLEVFDLQGRLVRTLANGSFNAGSFSLAWDHNKDSGVSVLPGIYFYRMSAGGFRAQAKMLLMP